MDPALVDFCKFCRVWRSVARANGVTGRGKSSIRSVSIQAATSHGLCPPGTGVTETNKCVAQEKRKPTTLRPGVMPSLTADGHIDPGDRNLSAPARERLATQFPHCGSRCSRKNR